MTVHEFGKENKDAMLLIHPSVVKWDYFEYVIPLLEDRYHLIVPALPGYDFEQPGDFTSVEEIAEKLAAWCLGHGCPRLKATYGCSMGGSIALRMAVDGRVRIDHTILDGAITPYQLPWLLTRLILLRDFALLAIGKLGGKRLIAKAFSTDDYSPEDMKYIAEVLRHCSCRTLWRTFDSCNNYKMPKPVPKLESQLHYWYAEHEEKARKWDIRYIKENVPGCTFQKIPGLGHGGLATLKPQLFAELLTQTLSPDTK